MAKRKTAHECCDKMCAMTCCPCHLDIKKLKPLVRNAKFICKVSRGALISATDGRVRTGG